MHMHKRRLLTAPVSLAAPIPLERRGISAVLPWQKHVSLARRAGKVKGSR